MAQTKHVAKAKTAMLKRIFRTTNDRAIALQETAKQIRYILHDLEWLLETGTGTEAEHQKARKKIAKDR